MNIEDIHSCIKNPLQLSAEKMKELGELVKEYPYFQTAHLLFIKSLHDNKNIRYADQLKVAAGYTTERKKLFELIKSSPKQAQVRETSKPDIDDKITIAENTLAKLREYKKKKEEELQRSQQKHQQHSTEEEHIIDEAEMLDFDYSENEKKKEQEAKEEKKKKDFSHLHHQLIDYLHTYNAENVKDEEIDFSQISDPDKQERQKKSLNLINSFLDKSPRIIPKKTEDDGIQDISESSIEDSDLMSETLAHIYMRQKNYPKAIMIYEKLMLKYPEKNTYFATKINDIRDLASNT